MARFGAVLDTCVLVPVVLCDTLLTLADCELYEPIWSAKTIRELSEVLQRVHPELSTAAIERRVTHMQTAFPEACIETPEAVIAGIALPDENDRHVVAAAALARAEIIVTENLRDFPHETLSDYRIEAISADDFLLDLLDLDSELAFRAIQRRVATLDNPKMTLASFAQRLARSAPRFAERVNGGLR